jgi:hypothetical protein
MEINNMSTYKLGCARPVCQFDMKGKFIKEWKSSAFVRRDAKIYHVNEVCNGLRGSAGGFLWKWRDECTIKDLSNAGKY